MANIIVCEYCGKSLIYHEQGQRCPHCGKNPIVPLIEKMKKERVLCEDCGCEVVAITDEGQVNGYVCPFCQISVEGVGASEE